MSLNWFVPETSSAYNYALSLSLSHKLKIWDKFVQEIAKGWLSCDDAEDTVSNASRG